MRVISVMNRKGGVGKTTTTVNMAAILAGDAYNKRVIVIDADPQCNATDFFGVRGAAGLYDWYNTTIAAAGLTAELLVTPTNNPNLGVVAGSLDFDDLDTLATPTQQREGLRKISALCRELEDYADIILIDCPPSWITTSCAAILASEEVIIPVKPDGFVFSGVREMARQIRSLQNVNPYIRIAGALVTMWHNSEAVKAGEAALRECGVVPVFDTVIRRTDKVDESTLARQTLDSWSPYSAAGVDYRKFVAEYMGCCYGKERF